MRFPNFLIIGAMKSGTTSLCEDLATHPQIYIPPAKEPHNLVSDEVLSPSGKKEYAALFRQASADQICGEASTGYTQLPTYSGVAQRTKALLGDDVRLIYIMRDPIARALSHHYHLVRGGDASTNFAEAIQTHPELIDFSCYGRQLEPWVATFGREPICAITMESYLERRDETLQKLQAFLGVEPQANIAPTQWRNQGETQRTAPGPLKRILRSVTYSQWYKRAVQPVVPRWLREGVKARLYRPAAARPVPPAPEVLARLVEHLRADAALLDRLLGDDRPRWDLEESLAQHTQRTKENRQAA